MEITCPTCTGSGQIRVTHGLCNGNGCNDCSHTGKVWQTCGTCHGRGKL